MSLAPVGVIYLVLASIGGREPAVDWSVRRVPVNESMPAEGMTREALRFAVATMVSPETTFSTYRQLVRQIGRAAGLEAAFVLRRSYAETRRDLEAERVDVAMVCTGTHALCAKGGRVELLAQPEFRDGLQYRSVLLVPASSPARAFSDRRGGVMGFTDPESNTGCMVPTDFLLTEGATPERFFRKVIFTGSHDRSIRATALGVVDAATVDLLIWAPASAQDPELSERIRVLWESPPFGPPPIVVPAAGDVLGLPRLLLCRRLPRGTGARHRADARGSLGRTVAVVGPSGTA